MGSGPGQALGLRQGTVGGGGVWGRRGSRGEGLRGGLRAPWAHQCARGPPRTTWLRVQQVGRLPAAAQGRGEQGRGGSGGRGPW